ncbi:H-NS histone family protein [Burkholderia ubonensis]|uniref:H-NS histone family protein n=1 Tax=Burkholderia ubonensis TaxID=101571 RepID=UPI0008FE277D|nr:H-NS histone family protein [Burkholderia ubonensis]
MSELKMLLAQRAELDAKIAAARVAERKSVLNEIGRLVMEFEITSFEIRQLEKITRRSTVVPRFFNPETGATWSGRGRRPKWLNQYNLDAYRLSNPDGE